jgi:predicted alpha/beta-fold hydrolase
MSGAYSRCLKPHVVRAEFALRGWRCGDRTRCFATRFFPRPDRNSQFQSLTFPGSLFTPPFMPPPQEGTLATIFGILRLPEGTGRVPAMVVTHGCSGLTGAETYWGRSLIQLGVATFVVNSFAGRSIPRVCTGPHTISTASVLTDVYRARDLLAAHPRIDLTRIAVMGFSLGGRTALWASQPRNATVPDRRALQLISRFTPQAATSGLPMKIA